MKKLLLLGALILSVNAYSSRITGGISGSPNFSHNTLAFSRALKEYLEPSNGTRTFFIKLTSTNKSNNFDTLLLYPK